MAQLYKTTLLGRANPNYRNDAGKKTCLRCGTPFYSYATSRKFCALKCWGIAVHGEAYGHLTSEQMKIRTSRCYLEWRKSVFERDHYTCVLCGAKNHLNADHIKPFAYFSELRFELANGRTLCEACHRNTDTRGRRYLKQLHKKGRPE